MTASHVENVWFWSKAKSFWVKLVRSIPFLCFEIHFIGFCFQSHKRSGPSSSEKKTRVLECTCMYIDEKSSADNCTRSLCTNDCNFIECLFHSTKNWYKVQCMQSYLFEKKTRDKNFDYYEGTIKFCKGVWRVVPSWRDWWRNNECSIHVQFMLRPDQKAHKFYVTNLFLHKQFFIQHKDQNFDLNM